MSKEANLNLMWRGEETIQEAVAAVDAGRPVSVILPENFHHALYGRLRPGDDRSHVETLDVSGGAEILEAMAGVAGLEQLRALAQPVRARGYRVRLGDPAALELTPPT
jgi:hypothetical protein